MKKNKNILSGFLSGFALMLVIGWIPVFGPFLSGLIAGLVTKNSLYGMLVSFSSSLAASVLILFAIVSIFKSTYLIYLLSLFDINLNSLIILIGAISVLISTIGGYVGGALRH